MFFVTPGITSLIKMSGNLCSLTGSEVATEHKVIWPKRAQQHL